MVSITFRALMALLAGASIWFAVFRVAARARNDVAIAVFGALWISLILRFTWDATGVAIPMDLPWTEDFLFIFGVTLLPAVALFQLPAPQTLDLARRIMILAGTTAGMLTLFSIVNLVRSDDKLTVLSRFSTESLNPISLGHLGVTLVVVALLAQNVAVEGRFAAWLDAKPAKLVSGFLGILLAIGSGSKGPMLSLVAVFVLWQAGRALRSSGSAAVFKTALRLLSILIVVVMLAIALESITGLQTLGRFANLLSDTSTTDRQLIMSRALHEFELSPWFGYSFVEVRARFYPHNVAVETLMATGLVGGALLAALLALTIDAAVRLMRTRFDWVVLLYGQYLVAAMASGSAYFDPQFWAITMALIATDRAINGFVPLFQESIQKAAILTDVHNAQ